MKRPPKIIMELTSAELDALAHLVHQGYGDGDAEEGHTSSEVKTIRRVLGKVIEARNLNSRKEE